MYFISLGRKCTIGYHIKKYMNNDVPTQFFDWTRVDFRCVLQILKLDCIDKILNIENINVDNTTLAHENDILITLKNFDEQNLTLYFRHEIKLKEYSDLVKNDKLIEFIAKYKRRYDRLIKLIKSNETLCFIHYDIESLFDFENDINDFYKTLKEINKDVDFCLVIIKNDKNEDYTFIKHKQHLQINITKFIDESIISKPEDVWKSNEVEWIKIFELIKKNY